MSVAIISLVFSTITAVFTWVEKLYGFYRWYKPSTRKIGESLAQSTTARNLEAVTPVDSVCKAFLSTDEVPSWQKAYNILWT